MARVRFVAAASLIAWVALAHGLRAEPARVSGTSVRLAPPPGFLPADRFPGFQEKDRGASIMVTEIPGPTAEVRRGMTREGLASRGMTLIESRTVKVDGNEALLLHASQRAHGMTFLKWMLVGGSSERTVIVVGTFPSQAADLSQPIRRSLLSARWEDTPRSDLFEGLAFRVSPTPELRLAGRVSNMVILTESGRMAPAGRDTGLLGMGSSLADVEIGDLEAFSRRRLSQTDRLEDIRRLRGHTLSVDGLPGYELTGEGTDPESRRSVGVYQLLLMDGTTYYIAQGFVASERMEKLLPAFRQVARSFRRNGRGE